MGLMLEDAKTRQQNALHIREHYHNVKPFMNQVNSVRKALLVVLLLNAQIIKSQLVHKQI